MSDQVDRLIDNRPGKALMADFVYDDEAIALTDFLYQSQGSTSAYMLVTEAGRMVPPTPASGTRPCTTDTSSIASAPARLPT